MDGSETARCPPEYIKTVPGILKCVEVVRTIAVSSIVKN